MDNHLEEKEPLIAQSRAGEAGANLTDVLAACPFCGVIPDSATEFGRYVIYCTNPECGMQPIIDSYGDEGHAALKAWNTRAANDEGEKPLR